METGQVLPLEDRGAVRYPPQVRPLRPGRACQLGISIQLSRSCRYFEQKRGGAGDNTVYTLLLLLLLFAAESPKQKQKHWTVLSEQVPSPLLVVRTAIHSRSTSSPDPQPRSYHRRVPTLLQQKRRGRGTACLVPTATHTGSSYRSRRVNSPLGVRTMPHRCRSSAGEGLR